METYFTLYNLINLVDISTTAIFIYAALVLLRKTRSIFIFRGIAILVAVYIVASFLGFKLTTFLFQAFFSFFVIILVVLFQRELRRFFENFSIIDLLNPFSEAETEAPIKKSSIETLTNSIRYLAKKKIGALIVLTGRQRIDRFLDGGYAVDGIVSEPLILSLFDPRTPGHDGAVILETNLIKKFGVHLPLSENFKQFGNLGTRHTAGLGLSEKSDALIIIVSEERGTITIADQGKMKVVTLDELTREVTSFLDDLHPESKETIFHTLIAHNKRDKLLSLATAILLRVILIGK
ncbi:MAG: DNA integrity scanning protein DisA nucleotide-binding domain protein [Candidatus Vogelbacteria bacterium]|nr:DNA integrity scanning protein DisA nucleotide-binding domain protein [Candidatus Vogelbacteria bacterium]